MRQGVGVNDGTVLHWDGNAWSSVTNPMSGTQNSDLSSVWGSGLNDVWAVGNPGGTIVHWNGSAWSSVTSTMNGTQMGVWGSGPNDVWAVGVGVNGGTILHYQP